MEVTLVLVLVAGTFLAIYAIFGKTIANDSESSNEVIASNLAQEGVEIVRNIRDRNVLDPSIIDMGRGITDNCYPYANYSAGTFSCSAGTNKVSKNGNIYQNSSSGDETIFSRTCSIGSVDGSTPRTDAFAVSCVVSWKGISGIPRKARAMEILTNWQ